MSGVAAVVLAAGAARRFGSQKLLAPVAGRPLVVWTVERVLASRVDDVIVVVGRDGDAVSRALASHAVRIVHNAQWAGGLSTSLHAGLSALAPTAEAVVVALGDQPAVSPAVIDRLIVAWHVSGRPVVVPRYRGERGNPVLFARRLVLELLGITGDRGARDVIARDASRVELVEVDGAMPRDADTPGALEAVARELEARDGETAAPGGA